MVITVCIVRRCPLFPFLFKFCLQNCLFSLPLDGPSNPVDQEERPQDQARLPSCGDGQDRPGIFFGSGQNIDERDAAKNSTHCSTQPQWPRSQSFFFCGVVPEPACPRVLTCQHGLPRSLRHCEECDQFPLNNVMNASAKRKPLPCSCTASLSLFSCKTFHHMSLGCWYFIDHPTTPSHVWPIHQISTDARSLQRPLTIQRRTIDHRASNITHRPPIIKNRYEI